MNSRQLSVAAAVLAFATWQWVSSSERPLLLAQGQLKTGAESLPIFDSVNPDPLEGPGRRDIAQPVATASAAANIIPTPNAVVHPPMESYLLTRSLSGHQNIQFEGREQRLLGTRDVSSHGTRQTILLVRDELSGSIGYWQSGLRLALEPGVDQDAFLREHNTLIRQFVNSDYIDVAADAASLAVAYRSLSGDSRVADVQLLRLQRHNKPR